MCHRQSSAHRAARAALLAIAAIASSAAAASAASPSGQASCVGQYSQYFAQGGDDRHRSEVAQGFAHGDVPAGSIYSQVAEVHGSLEACQAIFG